MQHVSVVMLLGAVLLVPACKDKSAVHSTQGTTSKTEPAPGAAQPKKPAYLVRVRCGRLPEMSLREGLTERTFTMTSGGSKLSGRFTPASAGWLCIRTVDRLTTRPSAVSDWADTFGWPWSFKWVRRQTVSHDPKWRRLGQFTHVVIDPAWESRIAKMEQQLVAQRRRAQTLKTEAAVADYKRACAKLEAVPVRPDKNRVAVDKILRMLLDGAFDRVPGSAIDLRVRHIREICKGSR